jgi:hypothetical protein
MTNYSSEDIECILQKILNEIDSNSSDALVKFPIKKYIYLQSHYPYIANYKYVSPHVMKFARELLQHTDKNTLGIYNKYALLTFISLNANKLDTSNLPDEIKENYAQRFQMILRKINNTVNDNSYYHFDQDKFLKYLAISKLRMIPAGVQNLDIDKLSRGFIFRNGLMQFFTGFTYVLRTCGGFKPFYRMHMNQLDAEAMAEFNEEGWEKLFKRLTALLDRNKNIRGVAGNSWIFDPIIREVSPELGYIHELIIKYNGKLFLQGSDSQTIRNATFLNANRKKLYAEKRYMPKRYLLVIPRRNFLKDEQSILI